MIKVKTMLKIAMIICVIAVICEFRQAAAAKVDSKKVGRMSGFSAFELEALKAHNEYRRLHNSPPLTLSRELCDFAKEWAQHLLARNVMQHRPNNNYGENIYMAMGKQVSGRDAVKAWYDEINDYDFSRPGFGMDTGHFTQVVWRGSTELGIAIATNGRTSYVVANYNPPGNYEGEFPENVQPLDDKRMPVDEPKAEVETFGAAADYDELEETRNKFSSFELEALAAHNEYRKQHNAPPLRLNSKLSKYAQDWAKNLAARDIMEHRPNNKYGENIYYAWGKEVNGRDAVQAWYDEVKDYNFNRPGFGMNTGHFTQVVWRASTELGIGVAKRGKTTYVVANYNPPGNFQGRFPENVLPKKN